MPDASWWDTQALPQGRSREELEARVRRLESVLLRVRDGIEQAQSWPALQVAADRARRLAEQVLGERG